MAQEPEQVPLWEQLGRVKTLYHEPAEVHDQLVRLFGVTPEIFLEAERHGWLEWANRSEYDSKSFPGTLLHGHTLRHERRLFVEEGWVQDDRNNFASVISPDGRMAIAVETGDRMTATTAPGKHPTTNSRKGPQTMQMIRDNQAILQGNLFTGYATPAAPLNPNAPLLWFHLIHIVRGNVVSEVSLPSMADHRNKIVGWKCRIILPRLNGGDGGAGLRVAPPAPSPIAEVQVNRRVG